MSGSIWKEKFLLCPRDNLPWVARVPVCIANTTENEGDGIVKKRTLTVQRERERERTLTVDKIREI